MNNTNISDAMYDTLQSVNESDCNGENANVVDGLYMIARAIDKLANAVLILSGSN